ncbi:MAG: peptidase S9 [Phycisphaerae bacterium]|nr:MAG: peptidase S9 [Phycisphaerae bacterium]
MKHSALAVLAVLLNLGAHAAPPETAKVPVTDEHHGVKVVDAYRWLEDWNDPKVKAWSEAQNAYARGILDKLEDTEAIRTRAAAVLSATGAAYFAPTWSGGRLFAMKRQPPKQQPFIVVMPSPMHPDQERVLVDPNVIDPEGGASIDWYVPSPDGALLAVSMSTHGSEAGDIHLFDTKTGKQVHEVITRVNGGTAGGSLAWAPDGKGFYYTRYPRAGERPAEDMDFYVQVYFHRLGDDPAKDTYEVGKEFPRIAEIQLECLHTGGWAGAVLASVQLGDGGEFMHFIKINDAWKQFTKYEDRIVQATFAPSGLIVMISRKDAPRGKIVATMCDEWSVTPGTLVPEGEYTIVSEFLDPEGLFLATENALYITYQLGGPGEVRAFDYHGKPRPAPALGDVTSPTGLTALDGGKLLVGTKSYIAPLAWGVFDPAAAAAPAPTPLSSKFPFSLDDYEVVREFATSKDGTKVPVNIIRRKGLALDGRSPCLVTAYGGYGVNIEPTFRPGTLLLLEQGFVWAEANIRGGGEFGDAWHRAGNLTNKQNVFDDFAAAVKHLQTRGYTNPTRTAITGGSNGGLLMGATLTQHPDLIACVVSHVGIYDMLRVELSSNGAFNIPEFGTVKNPDHFKALYAYSPYHRVVEGVKYPPVLFLTGANDPRVDPMQSRKMTARLQAVGGTCLLRTSSNSGHGAGTALNERIEQTVDVNAFILSNLGLAYRPVQ